MAKNLLDIISNHEGKLAGAPAVSDMLFEPENDTTTVAGKATVLSLAPRALDFFIDAAINHMNTRQQDAYTQATVHEAKQKFITKTRRIWNQLYGNLLWTMHTTANLIAPPDQELTTGLVIFPEGIGPDRPHILQGITGPAQKWDGIPDTPISSMLREYALDPSIQTPQFFSKTLMAKMPIELNSEYFGNILFQLPVNTWGNPISMWTQLIETNEHWIGAQHTVYSYLENLLDTHLKNAHSEYKGILRDIETNHQRTFTHLSELDKPRPDLASLEIITDFSEAGTISPGHDSPDQYTGKYSWVGNPDAPLDTIPLNWISVLSPFINSYITQLGELDGALSEEKDGFIYRFPGLPGLKDGEQSITLDYSRLNKGIIEMVNHLVRHDRYVEGPDGMASNDVGKALKLAASFVVPGIAVILRDHEEGNARLRLTPRGESMKDIMTLYNITQGSRRALVESINGAFTPELGSAIRQTLGGNFAVQGTYSEQGTTAYGAHWPNPIEGGDNHFYGTALDDFLSTNPVMVPWAAAKILDYADGYPDRIGNETIPTEGLGALHELSQRLDAAIWSAILIENEQNKSTPKADILGRVYNQLTHRGFSKAGFIIKYEPTRSFPSGFSSGLPELHSSSRT